LRVFECHSDTRCCRIALDQKGFSAVFKNVFQIAYVTNDLRRAVSVLQSEEGVAQLAIFDDFTLDVEGGRTAVINVALGYVGETQLEIIEPVSGEVDLYRTWLPEEFALRHHHFCHRLDSVEELEALQATYEQGGYAIPLSASLGETRLFYADTTAVLDHYQEYAWIDSEAEQFMATLPRN
jgi:hypothetical protein